MYEGGKQLEQLFLEAGDAGQRILHLSGHTHWSDLFLARRGAKTFERVPFKQLTCESHIDVPAMMVNAPSATRITFKELTHGDAFGFVVLKLLQRESVVQFKLYDAAGLPLAGPPCDGV